MPTSKRYKKDFFSRWTHDMAYVLGFLCADGNIVQTKRGTHFVSFYSSDKILLSDIRAIAQSKHKISKRISKTGAVYRLQVGSREWFDDITKLGIHPRKSRRLIVPMVEDDYVSDFIRGYFDGDGNIWYGYMNKQRVNPTLAASVAFTSASQKFLTGLKHLLHKQGCRGGSIYTNKDQSFSRLSFSTNDALKIYEIMYTSRRKPFLRRKKVVFERFMKLRKQR